MSELNQERKEQRLGLLKVLPIWLQIIIGLVTVGGFIVAALNFFNPLKKVDVTVWVQQEVPVTLPAEIGSVPLILKYNEENISRATVLKIGILNSGSTPVGEKEQWTLNLRTDEGSKIIVLANPESNPTNIDVKIAEGTTQNSLPLQIGLFNPRDFIDLRLLIINPLNVEHPIIKAETRVPHLTEPIVTRETLEKRLNNAYQLPIFIFFTILLFLIFMLMIINQLGGSFSILTASLMLLVLAAFISIGLSTGLTWVLVKLALA